MNDSTVHGHSTSRKPIAVVTGASSVIGAATARELGRQGFTLVVTARRQERLEPLTAEFAATAYRLDVRDGTAIAEFAASVGERFGRVDVLVNNAGLALGASPWTRRSMRTGFRCLKQTCWEWRV